MLSNIFSHPQVRWRSSTNTQSLPRYRLSIMPSQNASRHVPWHHCTTHWEITHEATSTRSICGLCGPRLGGRQTRYLPTSCWHGATGFLVLEHRPEAIDAWVQTLRTCFNGQPVAVCLELNKGPIVSALRAYDFLVLFPINPFTLAKYREAFTPSHAKDDPTDAELQVELLLKHRDKLAPLSPQSPTMRALAQLVEHRRRLVGDKVRLTNRLTSALKNYFPTSCSGFRRKIRGSFATSSVTGRRSKQRNSRDAPLWSASSRRTTCALPTASRPASRPLRALWR